MTRSLILSFSPDYLDWDVKTESSSSVTDSTILLSLELTQPSVYEEHYSTICVLLERSVVLFSIISLFWSEPTEVLLLRSRFDPLWYVTLYTEDVVLKTQPGGWG